MKTQKRSFLLVLILFASVMTTVFVAIFLLYQTAVKEHKHHLLSTVSSNAKLLNAVAAYDKDNFDKRVFTNAEEATLMQIKSAHNEHNVFGKTGEFLIAKKTHNTIQFLLPTRHQSAIPGAKFNAHGYLEVPVNNQFSLPMKKALQKQFGTMVSKDYRNETVIAAYAYIENLDYGFVAKIDLQELQQPFWHAAQIALLVALLLITIGSFLFLRINNQVIKEIEDREQYSRTLFETASIGLVLCDQYGNLIDVNPEFAYMLGYEIDDIQYLNEQELTPDNYRRLDKKQHQHILNTDELVVYQKEYLDNNGNRVPVRLSCRKITLQNQTYIWISVEDIRHEIESGASLQQAIDFSKQILNSAPLGIVIYDKDGYCIEANDTIIDMLSTTRISLFNKTLADMQCWKDSGAYKLVVDSLTNRINNRTETLITTHDKSRYFEVLTTTYEVQGQLYVLVVLNDINKRKETEIALIKSEEAFATAQAIANIGNWDWDMPTGKIAWTDEIYRIFGFTPNQFEPSYEAFLERIHPDDRQAVIDAVNDSVANLTPYNIEHRVVRPSGELRYVHEQGIVYCENDTPVRMIGTVHDVTEFKKVDLAHKEQVEKNQMILNTTQEGYWIVSPEGNILDTNKAYCEITGYSKSELINKPIHEIDVIQGPQEVAAIIEGLKKEGFIKFETQHRCKDGRIIDMDVTSSFAELGSETYLVGFFKDITERKHNEAELQKHRENLEQLVAERTSALKETQEELVRKERLATLGQLTATISHELRNPLSAMSPSLYVLNQLCDKEEPKVGKAIQILERSVWRCDNIINELLDYTRISNIQLDSIVLEDLLDEILSEIAIPDAVHVVTDYHRPRDPCMLDTSTFRRAVINTVENACQAMQIESSDEFVDNATLSVVTEEHDGKTSIRITDTGCGIAADKLEKIFEPLYSTKVYGVGLGMPTIKQIMEQHQGGIEIESEEGKGTSIILWLPCRHVTSQ